MFLLEAWGENLFPCFFYFLAFDGYIFKASNGFWSLILHHSDTSLFFVVKSPSASLLSGHLWLHWAYWIMSPSQGSYCNHICKVPFLGKVPDSQVVGIRGLGHEHLVEPVLFLPYCISECTPSACLTFSHKPSPVNSVSLIAPFLSIPTTNCVNPDHHTCWKSATVVRLQVSPLSFILRSTLTIII